MFIMPTRALECFGLPILESLAYGLPVISSDAAAIPELMTPILPECVIPAGNIEALKCKIQNYLDDYIELPSSESLKNHVKNRYGIEIIKPKLIKFLES